MKISFKTLFGDILKLYRHFINWNIAKVMFFVYSLLLAIISILPLLLIYYIYCNTNGLEFGNFFIAMYNGILINDFLGNILTIIAFFLSTLVYFYFFILLFKQNKHYLDSKKIKFNQSFFEDFFLDYKLFFKYIGLSTILFLFAILSPIVIIFIVFSVIVMFAGGLDVALAYSLSNSYNWFIGTGLFLFIALILICSYLFYRSIFAYFVLIETDEKDKKMKVFQSIKESFRLTKPIKHLLSFSFIVFLFMLIYFPIKSVGMSLEGTKENLSSYMEYIELSEEHQMNLKGINPYKYESLELLYSDFSKEELVMFQNRYFWVTLVFTLIKFLCVTGVFSMVLTSFYTRVLKK